MRYKIAATSSKTIMKQTYQEYNEETRARKIKRERESRRRRRGKEERHAGVIKMYVKNLLNKSIKLVAETRVAGGEAG